MFDALLLLLILVAISLSALCFHKLKRIHLMLFEQNDSSKQQINNNYAQTEALMGLYQTLELRGPLPPLRGWAGSPDYLLNLATTVLSDTPQNVVECGSGSSSIVIAAALKKNGRGHLFSLDHSPQFAQKTREALKALNLDEWATIIDAPLTPYEINNQTYKWYEITGLEADAIDILNIDGPPMATNSNARYPALPLLREKFTQQAKALLDDSDRPEETATVKLWESEGYATDIENIDTEKGMKKMKLIGATA